MGMFLLGYLVGGLLGIILSYQFWSYERKRKNIYRVDSELYRRKFLEMKTLAEYLNDELKK